MITFVNAAGAKPSKRNNRKQTSWSGSHMLRVAWGKLMQSFLKKKISTEIFSSSQNSFLKITLWTTSPILLYCLHAWAVRDGCTMLCYARDCRNDTWADFGKDANKHLRWGPQSNAGTLSPTPLGGTELLPAAKSGKGVAGLSCEGSCSGKCVRLAKSLWSASLDYKTHLDAYFQVATNYRKQKIGKIEVLYFLSCLALCSSVLVLDLH